MLARERRLDGEAYLTEGFRHRYAIGSLPRVDSVKNLARVWQPSRLKGVRVRPESGIPFLTATQVFDIRPVPRKWLSPAHTPQMDDRYLTPGTVLVTCSGNVGDSLMAYRAHNGLLVSHDLLRVHANPPTRSGYLYTYFRTRHGRAVMTSSQYGNIIKHMEPEHLETVPVPRFDDDLESVLDADMRAAFGWRDDAFSLEQSAESVYAGAVGVRTTATLDDSCVVAASDMFAGRRRLDGYHYNAVARCIARGLGSTVRLSDVVDDVILPSRFVRCFMDGGIPFIGSEDIFKINPPIEKFLLLGSMKDSHQYMVEPGWLLIARSGQLYGTNGNVALADEWHVGKIVSEHVIRVRPSSGVRSGYLKACLGHPTLGQPLILRMAFGTSIPEIDPGDLGLVPVPRIGDRLEDEIAEKVETASALREKARKQEDGTVAKLEKRIDDALDAEGVERGPVKVNVPFDDAIRRALQVTPPVGRLDRQATRETEASKARLALHRWRRN